MQSIARNLAPLLALALIVAPLPRAAAASAPDPAPAAAVASQCATEPMPPVESRTWDETSGSWVGQRLAWSPRPDEGRLGVRYWRDGRLALDGALELGPRMVAWDAEIGTDHLRVERSWDGAGITEHFLRVWVNGQPVPAFGDWALDVWARLADVSAAGLAEPLAEGSWIGIALGLLDDPDRYRVVSREFADLVQLWRELFAPAGPRGAASGWDCVICGIAVLGVLATTAAVLVGAPTGGLALGIWLIEHYAGLAGMFYSCVQCAIWVKEDAEEEESFEAKFDAW
jgi:hypothetical protein